MTTTHDTRAHEIDDTERAAAAVHRATSPISNGSYWPHLPPGGGVIEDVYRRPSDRGNRATDARRIRADWSQAAWIARFNARYQPDHHACGSRLRVVAVETLGLECVQYRGRR